jgi:hypothetical protein
MFAPISASQAHSDDVFSTEEGINFPWPFTCNERQLKNRENVDLVDGLGARGAKPH